MKIHELRTWPEYFAPIIRGHKTFELRENDRGFQVNDILNLKEWDPGQREYTGRECFARVLYMLPLSAFVLGKDAYVIMSIDLMEDLDL